jgi:hypothetical protein
LPWFFTCTVTLTCGTIVFDLALDVELGPAVGVLHAQVVHGEVRQRYRGDGTRRGESEYGGKQRSRHPKMLELRHVAFMIHLSNACVALATAA